MNGWLSVEEATRICGTDVQRITLWMNGNHIAFARFDNVLMIDGASLFALFERNRVDTIYDELSIFTTEHLLIHLKRYRLSRLYCVRNFGSQSGTEILRWLHRNELIDDGGSRDFRVLYP